MLATAIALSATATYAALALDFANVVGSSIQFNGSANSFQFNPVSGSGAQFFITTPGSSATGDPGRFDNGPFSYGPIITTTPTPFGPLESAPVSGPSSTLTIGDASSGLLTGTVDFVNVSTLAGIGGLNASLLLNVSGLTYTPGPVPEGDLATIAANGLAVLSVTFNTGGRTLTSLSTGPAFSTSFAGRTVTASPIPEPSTYLAGVLLLLPFGINGYRSLRARSFFP